MTATAGAAGDGAQPVEVPEPVEGAERVEVPAELGGERVDVGLSRLFGISRSRAAELVADRAVTVDGQPVAKADRLRVGAMLTAELAAALDPHPEARVSPANVPELTILHRDDDIVVIDKPIGVAVHPSPGWTGPTVLGHLAAVGVGLASVGAAERQGVVHRLDVGTSGVMVLARSTRAYTALKQAFRERTVDKTYHALVQGHPDPTSGTVDAPIGRHPRADYKWAVVAGGRASVTHYATLEAFRHASLLEVHLETGRTHQIRVHFAALRHPCVGDVTYGSDPTLSAELGLTRQWLHAVRLAFEHPGTGRPVAYTSAYPADLAHALAMLRR
jgi:23S rRNA pseudouridine1911/1915/1917 synthase